MSNQPARMQFDLLGEPVVIKSAKKKLPKVVSLADYQLQMSEKLVKAKNALMDFLTSGFALPMDLFGQTKQFDIGDESDDDPPLPLVPEHMLGSYVTVHHTSEPQERKKDLPYDVRWYDHNILTAHEELLKANLLILTYPGTSESAMNDKLDVISWIFAGEHINYQGRLVPAEMLPFSFKACCMLAQYDQAVLQDFVYKKLPKEFQEVIWDACAA